MSTLEMIVEELKSLPPGSLEQAAKIVHQLKENSQMDLKAGLMSTAGCLTREEADELERIIEEGCEKIDERDW